MPRRPPRVLAALLPVLAAAACSAPTASPRHKLAPNLAGLQGDAPAARYLIRFDSVPFRGSESGALAGLEIIRRYRRLPFVAVRAAGSALLRSLESPTVLHASPDYPVRSAMDVAGPATGVPIAGAAGFRGRGVGIAVIDSGIEDHEDLSTAGGRRRGQSRCVASVDFTGTDRRARSGSDGCGHGTMVAGIIAGNGAASSGPEALRTFSGMASEAHLINLRVLDRHGMGRVSDAIAALDWCIENRERWRIRVVNFSLGGPALESARTDPLCLASEMAWKSGLLVVCAVGNRGRLDPQNPEGGTLYGAVNTPAHSPYVLTVGASRDAGTVDVGDDWVASYSSRGPTPFDRVLKPDLLAPGNRIISLRRPGSELERLADRTNLVPTDSYTTRPGRRTDYFELSGTSMAAAVVSGAAALLFEQDPTLNPDSVKARLMLSAHRYWRADGHAPDILSRGAGLLSIARALECPARFDRPALSPRAELVAGRLRLVLDTGLHGEAAGWLGREMEAAQVLWSDEAARAGGDARLWANQALWSERPAGRNSTPTTLWADQALWSDGPLARPQGLSATADARLWIGAGPVGAGWSVHAQQALWSDAPPKINAPGLPVWTDLYRLCIESAE